MTEYEIQKRRLAGFPLGVAWGFVYGYYGVPAERFLPMLRQLGGGFTKIYLFWNQLEPEKGRYDWAAVDAFVEQLEDPEEGLISVFSASQWATRRASELLPPSAAKDPGDYYRFIYQLVRRCRGRVRYWQNDAEPNNPVFWSGTSEEFVANLKVFHRAVKDADPDAVVVVGGYDGLFVPPSVTTIPPFAMQEAGLAFFDHVLDKGRDAFDIFDLRLYGDPYTIAPRIEYMRGKMRALGYEKPIFCTEYGGPSLFQFPANRQYRAWITEWSQLVSSGDLKDSPVSARIAHLYETMADLPPETQMFMQGSLPTIEARLYRIQARELVMRNLFALSAGVQKTLYWQLLEPRGDPNDLMMLMFGKIGMLGYENGALTHLFPVAEAFRRMAAAFHGVERVVRVDLPRQPELYFFQVDRVSRGSLYVIWERRDILSGEDAPPRRFSWTWTSDAVWTEDILGERPAAELCGGRVHISIASTPIFFMATHDVAPEPAPDAI